MVKDGEIKFIASTTNNTNHTNQHVLFNDNLTVFSSLNINDILNIGSMVIIHVYKNMSSCNDDELNLHFINNNITTYFIQHYC